MRLESIDTCAPGMRLGKEIVSEEGQVLLGNGFELTQNIIGRLRRIGVRHLYIADPRTDDIVIAETLREETRSRVHSSLLESAARMRSPGGSAAARLDAFVRTVNDCVPLILADVMDRRSDPILHIRSTATTRHHPDNHFCNNALNVAVLASKLAMMTGSVSAPGDLRAVCAAAIAHDIGKLAVPEHLLTKRSALTEAEAAEMRRHAELGYKLLKDSGIVPDDVATCALQHHERVDGLGYPHGLKEGDIHPVAQLVGMLDAYDALISPRSYRNAMLPHEALEYLYACVGTAYGRDQVEQFRNKVAIFPPGTRVTLSTGEQGVVSRLDMTCLHRPTVRVLTNPAGEPLRSPREVHLSRQLNIMIRSVRDTYTYNM